MHGPCKLRVTLIKERAIKIIKTERREKIRKVIVNLNRKRDKKAEGAVMSEMSESIKRILKCL